MKEVAKDKNSIIIGVVIGFVYAFFAYFYYRKLPTNHTNEIVLFIVRASATFLIIEGMLVVLLKAQQRRNVFFFENDEGETATYKSLFINLALLSLVWLPLLVIKYPGALCWDTWDMIHMYRTGAITTHHSVFYTVAIGLFIKVFEQLESANIGLFLFIIIHYLVYVFSFSYAINVLKKMGTKRWVRIVAVVLWIINPYIAGYIGVGIKDSVYTGALVLITALIVESSLDTHQFVSSKSKCILLCLALTLACLVRKNGEYLALFMIIVALVRTAKKKDYRRIVAVLTMSLIIMWGINSVLNAKYHVQPGSIAEALSVPFQQTARYVKHHENEISPSEREAINNVLDYERLPELYNPIKSDYVKGTYKGDNSKLKKYFGVWKKEFARHPKCYIAAFSEQNLYLFVPQANKENIVLYKDDRVGYEAGKEVNIEKDSTLYERIFSEPKALQIHKERVVRFYKGLYDNYIVGGLCNISICTYIFLVLLLKRLADKKKTVLEFSACIVTFAFALLGPAIFGHPRYLFPIVYSLPLLIVYYLSDSIETAKKD